MYKRDAGRAHALKFLNMQTTSELKITNIRQYLFTVPFYLLKFKKTYISWDYPFMITLASGILFLDSETMKKPSDIRFFILDKKILESGGEWGEGGGGLFLLPPFCFFARESSLLWPEFNDFLPFSQIFFVVGLSWGLYNILSQLFTSWARTPEQPSLFDNFAHDVG
jgi:hypothetical protein